MLDFAFVLISQFQLHRHWHFVFYRYSYCNVGRRDRGSPLTGHRAKYTRMGEKRILVVRNGVQTRGTAVIANALCIAVYFNWSKRQQVLFITKRLSVAKSVGYFQRRLFVCLFVCQHDNVRTSKDMMMKLQTWGQVHCTKSRPSWKLGVIAPWVGTPNNMASGYDIGKISACCLVMIRKRVSSKTLAAADQSGFNV